MTLYHASPVPGIQVLEPRTSNHGTPLVYFSDRRENTLVYLCNAVEKFSREAGLPPREKYQKWGPYGFTGEGLFRLDEYWPNATEEVYRGVSGYIYRVEGEGFLPMKDIPHGYTADRPVPVSGCEFVPDALAAFRQAEAEGRLALARYAQNSEEMLAWIDRTIREEHRQSENDPCYRAFLEAKFPFVKG